MILNNTEVGQHLNKYVYRLQVLENEYNYNNIITIIQYDNTVILNIYIYIANYI